MPSTARLPTQCGLYAFPSFKTRHFRPWSGLYTFHVSGTLRGNSSLLLASLRQGDSQGCDALRKQRCLQSDSERCLLLHFRLAWDAQLGNTDVTKSEGSRSTRVGMPANNVTISHIKTVRSTRACDVLRAPAVRNPGVFDGPGVLSR